MAHRKKAIPFCLALIEFDVCSLFNNGLKIKGSYFLSPTGSGHNSVE